MVDVKINFAEYWPEIWRLQIVCQENQYVKLV